MSLSFSTPNVINGHLFIPGGVSVGFLEALFHNGGIVSQVLGKLYVEEEEEIT